MNAHVQLETPQDYVDLLAESIDKDPDQVRQLVLEALQNGPALSDEAQADLLISLRELTFVFGRVVRNAPLGKAIRSEKDRHHFDTLLNSVKASDEWIAGLIENQAKQLTGG